MRTEYAGYDFRHLERLGSIGGRDHMPLEVYWMRAIDVKDVAATQTHKEHKHSFFELHFVLRGQMEYEYAGKPVTVACGRLLLLPPDRAHRVAYYSDDFLKLSVAFSATDEILHEALLEKSGQAIVLSDGMHETLGAILKEAERDAVYSRVIVSGGLLALLSALTGLSERRREGDTPQKDIRLERAKQFIADNMHVFLGCEDVASYCYISAKQLSRIFRRYEGVSLLQYIHREKLRAAEEMLKAGEKSIQEISDALGFSSVYYFHAFFVKNTGITPGQSRKART